ncbi:PREDICTED: 50S ribosomal protein L34, chloroplastic [Tarenaya hassleriana]|uniref:50S ribosomal protein L34, chloroplastic n=1 Tax=Tarenaya hassleriana TaxID=28532 RepID=UPI00053C742C|nr:PREDICTED: 50S ribosomal protein L34, chloroplastic [Tarenaya hassleriana]
MASISISAVASSTSWLSPGTGKFTRVCVPSASLSLCSGSRRSSFSLAASASARSSSPLLHSSFLPSSLSLSSSFSGLSIEFNLNLCTRGLNDRRRKGLVVRAGKYTLCQTKRNRSRKSLARTHGFRRRMRTTSGRATLKRRRAKGRWDLCPKSNPSSGKRA